MLDYAKKSWTLNMVLSMYNNGKFFFDNIIQRGLVWETWRKSDLIHSLCEGWPVPTIYARRLKGEGDKFVYDLLDGKQRLKAVLSYMTDEFALEGISPVQVAEDGEYYDINGKKFSELPKEVQTALSGASLDFYYADNLNEEKARIMFKKLNSGKPLNNKEINIASCVDISNFSEMAKHPLFDAILTDKAKGGKKQIFLLEKMWLMLNKPLAELTFEAKTFNNLVSSIESTEDERKAMRDILDKMYSVYNLMDETTKAAKRKMGCETHFVSLVPFFKKAVDENISTEMMKDYIVSAFSSKSPVSDRYSAACRAGSAKNYNIVTRDKELELVWNNFFAQDESEIVEVQKGNVELNGEDEAETDVVEAAEVPEAVEAVEAVEVSEVPETSEAPEDVEIHLYKYGMRLRGAAPGAQPEGMKDYEDGDENYHSFIYYDRELTAEEGEHYSLDYIGM